MGHTGINQSVSRVAFFSGKFQFSSVTQSCPTLCDPVDCSMPAFPVHHQLLELTQTRVHWVGDAIQSSHPLSSPSPPAFNLSQHQALFQWVSSLHQVAKVWEFQLQHLEGLGGIYFLVFSNFWKLLEVLASWPPSSVFKVGGGLSSYIPFF